MKNFTILLLALLVSNLSLSQVVFEDDFDGSGPGIAAWTVVNNDGLTPNAAVAFMTDAWLEIDRQGANGNFGGPAGNFCAMSTSYYTPAGASDDWLITPAINLTGNFTLAWDAKAQDPSFADGYEVRISTTGTNIATDFATILLNVPSESATWQTRTIDLSAYNGDTVYIAWRNNSFDDFLLLVDNVSVTSCAPPSDFVLDDVTTTTADISWMDANGGGATFEFEYGLDGFTQGTGTTLTPATPAVMLTSLMENTEYDFYCRTDCGGGDFSDWVGPISFRTLRDCTASEMLPYSEGFSDSTILDCWASEDADASSPTWTYNSVNDLDGDGTNDPFMDLFPQSALENSKDDWLFSNKVDLSSGTTYDITIVYNVFDLNPPASESLDLVIADDQSSTAPFLSVLGSFSGLAQQGVFGDMTGNDMISQAYSSTAQFTPSSTGTYYVGVHATTTASANIILLLSLSVDITLSVDDMGIENFSYFYRDTTETLVLESNAIPMDRLEIYNLLGQAVLSSPLRSTEEEISLLALENGVYMVNIYMGNTKKTIRIVKH